MTIEHDGHDVGRIKSREEPTVSVAQRNAEANKLWAVDVPEEQSSIALGDKQANTFHHGHLTEGDHNVGRDTNPMRDQTREEGFGAEAGDSAIERYTDAKIRDQGVSGLDVNYQFNGDTSGSHKAAVAADVAGPTSSDASAMGVDGLTAATAFSAKEGSMKPLNDLSGLDEAVSGLRSSVGGEGGGRSLFSGGEAAAQGGSMLSPNHPSLQGAKDPAHMEARNAERNEAFAADLPEKR